jgi:hypothetical protein
MLGMLHRRASDGPPFGDNEGEDPSRNGRGDFSRTPATRLASDDRAEFMVGDFRQSRFQAAEVVVIVDQA